MPVYWDNEIGSLVTQRRAYPNDRRKRGQGSLKRQTMKLLDQIKSNAVPVELLRTAAKGALPLPTAEILEILVYLTQHPVCSEQAAMTLAGWDAVSAVQIVADPAAPPDVLGYFWLESNRRPSLMPALIENPAIPETLLVEAAASGGREVVNWLMASPRGRRSLMVVEALKTNPELGPEQLQELQGEFGAAESLAITDAETEAAHRAWHEAHAKEIAAEEGKPFELIGEDEDDAASPGPSAGGEDQPTADPIRPADTATVFAVAGLAAAPKAKRLPGDEKNVSLLKRIERMNAAERVKTAFNGNKEERMILIRDGAKVVQNAVLASPKLTEPEVEVFAASKSISENVLREIGRSRRFLKNYHVVRNLVNNPKCPLDVALTLVKNLLVYDLKTLRFNKGVPDTIRQVAGQLYREKTGPAKETRRR